MYIVSYHNIFYRNLVFLGEGNFGKAIAKVNFTRRGGGGDGRLFSGRSYSTVGICYTGFGGVIAVGGIVVIFHLQKLRIIFDNDEKNAVNVGAELLVYFNLLFEGFLDLRKNYRIKILINF